MTAILVLLVALHGQAGGVYLGEFKSPAACERAKPQAAEFLKDLPIIKQAEAAMLLCIPKRDA